MRHEGPLLTIAIPTYNRGIFLAQLLEVLVPQLDGESRVELLISDNASPDNTPAIVGSIQMDGPTLVYQRNESNIGADANFLQCLNMARGEYVWIVGDDDVIVEDGLRQVLNVLDRREFDLVFVSSYEFKGAYVPPDRSKLKGRVISFSNATDYALRIYTGLAFITGNIVRKRTLEERPHVDFSKMIGTSLIHLSWTYALLAMEPKCILIRDRLVAVRIANTGGYGTCQVFGKNLRDIVQAVLGVESPLGRAIINRNVQSFLPWATVSDRSGRSVRNLPEDTEGILRGLYGNNPRFWIFLWPALKLPLPLAKVWVFLGKVTNRMDRVIGYRLAR
jgi:glycosyltransferase involved in cell wall biosynthesis